MAQINGRRIAVDEYGNGEAMLLVHGLGGSSNFWRPIANAFKDRYRILIPDLPSAAGSELDPDVSIASISADLFALLDSMDVNKVHLVGHSMGTIVCQHMAAMQPHRVSSLVLLGPLAEPPAAARGALEDRAELARKHGMTPIADTISDVALSKATKRDKPNVQAFVREMLMRQSPEGYAVSCLALARAQRADPSAIKATCLLVTGDEDGVAPPANVKELESDLSSAELHVLDECGHWTVTERPGKVISLMTSYYGN